jgi:eukaryotic-like serine/threonine-protein kinase
MATLSSEIESTYEVLQRMGGGMGAVYKVRHRLFGEIRIIKVMQAAPAANQDLKNHFSVEGKRGRQLKHRNIAEVLDYQIGSNGNPHLIMEYIDGVNLRDELARRGGPLDPATVRTIGVQTLAALGYLHGRSLIHRDISPENLMITRDTEGSLLVKLIDLGIATSLEDAATLTRAGDFMGKISYASPEQFGGVVDARSDIYSLGVVLYELLTAAKPITGTNTAECIAAHCRTPPQPFSETDPQGHVSEAFRRVVLKALEKRPEDRYQTAAEFAAGLQTTLPASEAISIALAAPASTVTSDVTPPVPRTIRVEPQLAEATEIMPVPQPGRREPVVWQFVAVAGLVVSLAFVTAALFEKAKKRRIAPVTPSQSTAASPAVDGQPAGVSIVIEAPRPDGPASSPPPQLAVSSPPPFIDQSPMRMPSPSKSVPTVHQDAGSTKTHRPSNLSTTTKKSRTQSADPEPLRAADPSPARKDWSSRVVPDLVEGDRQRKRALAFSNAHQWSSAISAWREFIRVYSGINVTADHAAYYNLGVAYEALQDWREAADAFERAALADANINDTNNLLRLGRCYGKLGRWPDAVATYERVLRVNPANDTAKRSLLFALQQQPRLQ